MTLPNFFVIGAGKSGTTALYDALRQHPQIFMSPIKEPHYFAFQGLPPVFKGPAGDYYRRTGVYSPRDYYMLFQHAMQYKSIGEASPTYMVSDYAAEHIRQDLPDSKLVAVLRQPAERAYSNYMYFVQKGIEHASSFSEALEQEPRRREQGWADLFFYRHKGYYHQQLSRYFGVFPREQIRIYFYEDWKESPQNILQDLFGFLEVDPDFMPELRKLNVTMVPRSRRFDRFVRRLSKHGPAPLGAFLQRVNSLYNQVRPPRLDPAVRAELTAGYREDILRLQDLTGRDLGHWM